MQKTINKIVSLFACPNCGGDLENVPSSEPWISPEDDFACKQCGYSIPYIEGVPIFVPLHSIGWVGLHRALEYWNKTDKSVSFDDFYKIMQQFSNPGYCWYQDIVRRAIAYSSDKASLFQQRCCSNPDFKDWAELAADPVYSWIAEAIKPLVQCDSVILDVGIGGGDVERCIATTINDEATVIGIDIDIETAFISRQELYSDIQASKVILACADFRNLPLRKDTVDVVVSSGGLAHIDQFSDALANLHRVMKSGGYLIMVEFSRGLVQSGEDEVLRKYDIPKGYNDLLNRLLANEFEIIATDENVGLHPKYKQTGTILRKR